LSFSDYFLNLSDESEYSGSRSIVALFCLCRFYRVGYALRTRYGFSLPPIKVSAHSAIRLFSEGTHSVPLSLSATCKLFQQNGFAGGSTENRSYLGSNGSYAVSRRRQVPGRSSQLIGKLT